MFFKLTHDWLIDASLHRSSEILRRKKSRESCLIGANRQALNNVRVTEGLYKEKFWSARGVGVQMNARNADNASGIPRLEQIV